MSKGPLPEVYRRMKAWLVLVCLACVGLYYFKEKLYEVQSSITQGWPLWTGGVVFLVLFFFNDVNLRDHPLAQHKERVLIIFLIFLLALAVFITGGFIDSPFSGAISLYLAFFIALMQARTHPYSSWTFVALTIALILSPYLYLYWTNQPSLEYVRWRTSALVTALRLLITIFFLLSTAWVGETASGVLNVDDSSDPSEAGPSKN